MSGCIHGPHPQRPLDVLVHRDSHSGEVERAPRTTREPLDRSRTDGTTRAYGVARTTIGAATGGRADRVPQPPTRVEESVTGSTRPPSSSVAADVDAVALVDEVGPPLAMTGDGGQRVEDVGSQIDDVAVAPHIEDRLVEPA